MQENVLTFHKHFCPQKSFMVIWCFMDNMENGIFYNIKRNKREILESNQIKLYFDIDTDNSNVLLSSLSGRTAVTCQLVPPL